MNQLGKFLALNLLLSSLNFSLAFSFGDELRCTRLPNKSPDYNRDLSFKRKFLVIAHSILPIAGVGDSEF